ncbi:MAG: hypothetical protein ACJARZ_001986 [Dokdonia sp.]|jgi:hypothetical protein
MNQSKLIFFLLVCNLCFGQKAEVEDFINQILRLEAPENHKLFYLQEKGISNVKVYENPQNYQKFELYRRDNQFPFNLIGLENNVKINWSNYLIKNSRFIAKELNQDHPKLIKDVFFVKYRINESKLEKLNKNGKPHTLYVKKKWFWSKERIWKEVEKAWNEDEIVSIEEKIYFSVSHPIFSKNRKYARITISKERRCKGTQFTALYEKHNGIWSKLLEYNSIFFKRATSHVSCGDIVVSYKN